MGYFTIGKHKVFYSDARFASINKPFFDSLSAHEAISLNILKIDGTRNSNAIKLENLQIKKLNEDFKLLSKEHFVKKWVEFEFSDKVAQSVSWEIIYDFFFARGVGSIKDIRTFDQKLSDDFSGQGYSFPAGNVVELEFELFPGKNILRSFFKKRMTLTKLLDLSKIVLIAGSLDAMKIVTQDEEIVLGGQIRISLR